MGSSATPSRQNTPGSVQQSTPGSVQRLLGDVGVQRITQASPPYGSTRLVPVVSPRDPFDCFCERVSDAHDFHMKMRAAAESVDPWSNCPMEAPTFVKNCDEFSATERAWKYIATLWKEP